MKESYPNVDYPTDHVEASKRYFAEELQEDGATSKSFGDRKITPDYDITFGVTHSEDFEVAAIAIDVQLLNSENEPLEFTPSSEIHDVFVTCLINAIEPIRDNFEELFGDDEELPTHFGLMLLAEKREFEDEDERQKFVDLIEEICFPVPMDKYVPLTGYLFTAVGYEDIESPLSVGSLIFATGATLGDNSGFPPFWSYAENVAILTEE